MSEDKTEMELIQAAKSGGKVGAVLVVGGGIAAMQSSIDLADSGYQVYMVTNQPCIGGNMVRLDKTFPTNDCSMCIVSPKLVSVGNHPNIQIVTMSDIEKFEGAPGNFKIKVKKQARYIKESLCTGCAECSNVCPVKLPDQQNESLGDRRAAYRLYPQAVPNWFAIERDRTAPCKMTCPAHISAQGYVNLVGEGRFKDALDVVRMRIPFPSVCGRVCYHPCEDQCNRKDVDEPIAINAIKRFVSDLELEEAGIIEKFSGLNRVDDPSKEPGKLNIKEIEKKSEKVAIIGAGPAGLTAANDLAEMGFQVTVFEKLPVAGGMLAVGIPEYRLPMKVLEYEVEQIRKLGVEIKLNTVIDKDKGIDDLFAQGYRAVYIAVGAHGEMKMGVAGEQLPGVMSGVEFLRNVKLGDTGGVGKNVAIIGGGNVAIDAARTALRLGAETVSMVYRRSRDEMPAHHWEVEDAIAEGVEMQYLVTPMEIVADSTGRARAIKCLKNKLGEPDASGRRKPVPIEGSEYEIKVDTVIAAIGQRPELGFLEGVYGVSATKWNTVVVNERTAATARPGVFAGGDCVTGPAMAIQAIAAGKNAADSIARHINGEDLDGPRYEDGLLESIPLNQKVYDNAVKEERRKPGMMDAKERRANFREVERTFTPEEAVAEAKRCLNCGPCSDCRMCELACQQGAVDFSQREYESDFEVGAVVLATGFDTFDARLATQYGYGVFDNVYTSIEFERTLSASGPTMGHVIRRSDHKEPKKIAFIQCVGSRDVTLGNDYCSAVCCMYTAKEAVIAKEHLPGLDCTVFFIDERAHGKNFDRYYENAKKNGVKYVRGSISGVKELQRTKNLSLTYLNEEGKQAAEEFDMVVLAVGLRPSKGSAVAAEKFGVDLNRFGFCETPDKLNTVATSREGIYAAGAFESPKDIPDTVMQASGAACEVMIGLTDERGTRITPVSYPPERDVSKEEPRVGVMICHCGFNIGSVINIPDVVAFTKTLPGVAYAEESLYACSQDNLSRIVQLTEEHDLNRFVISSCTVRTHLPLFEQTMRRAGRNKYLFEMANIREQASWVHRESPLEATEKAKDLVAGAVARVITHQALEVFKADVIPRALIIGGGPAGMTAALAIADQGIEVFIVESDVKLGGNLNKIRFVADGDAQKVLRDMVGKVEAHPKIQVYLSHSIREVAGHAGHYTTRLIPPTNGSGEVRTDVVLEHGVGVVAIGGREYRPELSIGENSAVMTQNDLENKIADGDAAVKSAKTFVMIQCVGSRNDERPYCSKICCAQAVKNSIRIKEANPNANVYVLYRDIRTYGFKELDFLNARKLGVIFIRFNDGDDPAITLEGGKVRVAVNDDVIKKQIIFEPDVVALSVAVIPAETNRELSDILKVPVDADGFYLEAHAKLRPVEFASEGLFLCGVAHSPKPLEENITQAKAAAARAMTILSKEYIEVSGMVAHVDEDKCAACLTCVRVCPFGVPYINENNRAQIDGVSCLGCGTCAAECPAKAIEVSHFKDDQVIAQADAIIARARTVKKK